MNFLRRFYLGLLSVAVMVTLTLFLVSPQSVSTRLANLSELSSLVRILAAAILDILLLALLYIQIKPDPKAQTNGLMMEASGAITEVGVESARARILKAVNEVPDVVSVDAQVKPVHGKADVELQVTVMGYDVQLPAKQKEINRALNQVIHKQLGLRMAGQPRVYIRFHGEETVKQLSIPVVIPEPVKPVEVIAPVKPIVLEPEPQKTLGLFSRPHREEPVVEEEPIVTVPVIKSIEETPRPEVSPVDDQEPDDVLDLNLEDEIAHSSTDDIVVDEDSHKNHKNEDDENADKPVSLNNHSKESEPQ